MQAIDRRDYPVLQGIFLLLTMSVILFNLIADLSVLQARPAGDLMSLDQPLQSAEGLELGTTEDAAGLGTGRRPSFIRQAVITQPQAIVGLVILGFFVLLALVGPALLSEDPKTRSARCSASQRRVAAGPRRRRREHDPLLIAGARVSLEVGFLAALVAMFIGGSVGLASGFFGGRIDTVLMRFTDYILVIPDIPLMVMAAALFGRSPRNIIIIIGLIYWTSTARLIRAQVLSVRERVYVKRARSLGAGNNRLIFKHILPQVAPLLIANMVLMVALAIFAETFIAFLGLGDPSAISWGKLIENAFTDHAVLNDAWWAILWPGVCVTVVILACTMVGQSMEDALNPRLRVGHLSVNRFRVRVLPRKPPKP